MSALFALSARDANVRFVLLAYIPAVAFWGLDGYFLAVERAYRCLYDRVRQQSDEKIDFGMGIEKLKSGPVEWLEATFSKTLIPYHGSVIGAIAVVMALQW